jgi:hypothetical protein
MARSWTSSLTFCDRYLNRRENFCLTTYYYLRLCRFPIHTVTIPITTFHASILRSLLHSEGTAPLSAPFPLPSGIHPCPSSCHRSAIYSLALPHALSCSRHCQSEPLIHSMHSLAAAPSFRLVPSLN